MAETLREQREQWGLKTELYHSGLQRQKCSQNQNPRTGQDSSQMEKLRSREHECQLQVAHWLEESLVFSLKLLPFAFVAVPSAYRGQHLLRCHFRPISKNVLIISKCSKWLKAFPLYKN